MRNDDGHLALDELVKHLHRLAGVVLCKRGGRRGRGSFNSKAPPSTRFGRKALKRLRRADLIRFDEVPQGDDQTGNEGAHLVLSREQRGRRVGKKCNLPNPDAQTGFGSARSPPPPYQLRRADVRRDGRQGQNAVVQRFGVVVVLQHGAQQLEQLAVVRLERLGVGLHHLVQEQEADLFGGESCFLTKN